MNIKKNELKEKLNKAINSSYAETIAMEADILINSRQTTNPDIENAHKIAFPKHNISFADHVNSFDTIEQQMGVISGVKGKLFEIKVKDHLDNEFASEGLKVELAENVNQKGWDLVVKDQNNEPLNYFQVKCSDNIDYITSSTDKYPEFVHIVPEDVYKSSETLIDNDNIHLLNQIIQQYGVICEQDEKTVKVKITTAKELDSVEKNELLNAIENSLNKKVDLDNLVNPGILGGAQLRIGNMIIDGSIAKRLEKLEKSLY